MFPMRLFRSATFSGSVYVSCASTFVFYGLLFVLSLAFQQVRGWTALETGLALLPMTTMVAAGSLLSATIVRTFGLAVDSAPPSLSMPAARPRVGLLIEVNHMSRHPV